MLKTLQQAIQQKYMIEIIYMDAQNVMTKRFIKPLRIEGSLCRAYCFLRHSLRTFNVEQILALDPVKNKRLKQEVF